MGVSGRHGMTIGELARQGDVKVSTLRYYERRDLLPRPPQSDAGYRHYSAEDVRRVRFIRRAQELGFSLNEIKELLALRIEVGTGCADVRQQAEAKLTDIRHKIRDLQRMKKSLADLAAACPARGTIEECPILESLDGADSA